MNAVIEFEFKDEGISQFTKLLVDVDAVVAWIPSRVRGPFGLWIDENILHVTGDDVWFEITCENEADMQIIVDRLKEYKWYRDNL